MKTFIQCLCLLLLSASAFSQSQITGRVTSENNPVPFANVLLLHIADSSLAQGTICSESGVYIVDKLPKGRYILKYSSIGLSTQYTAAFDLTGEQGVRDFGT